MCAETYDGKILWKVTLVRQRHGWEEIIITVLRFIFRRPELKWLRMCLGSGGAECVGSVTRDYLLSSSPSVNFYYSSCRLNVI